jgi:hypothetical protein
MDLRELVNLITVRQYVVNSTANPALDKAAVNYMNGALLMIDKKIVELLQGKEFRQYINYGDVRSAIKEVVKNTNIKSGLRRNPQTGQLEKIK